MLVPIPLDRVVPLPELFRHRSTLHGQAHVARVMIHAMRLVEATGTQSYGPQLWASVFLHDLARTHDGVCHRHGADAAQCLRDEPFLQQRLAEAGLVEADYPAIEAAVTAHSAPKEVSREHPHWPLIALLKGRGWPGPRAAGRPGPALPPASRVEGDGAVCTGVVRCDRWSCRDRPGSLRGADGGRDAAVLAAPSRASRLLHVPAQAGDGGLEH